MSVRPVRLPFSAEARGVYVAAAITGLAPRHPLRRRVISYIQAVQAAGYRVLTNFMLAPTQAGMWRVFAQRIGVPLARLRTEPRLIPLHDLRLLRSAACRWFVADISVVSWGTGAELQAAWERLEEDPTFTALLLEGPRRRRQNGSPFIRRFEHHPQARVLPYQTVQEALARTREFLNALVLPVLGVHA